MRKVLITVVETPGFRTFAKRYLTENLTAELVDLLARQPETGSILRGTGGIRKLRLAREHGGKSGGYRIVYFYHGPKLPVFLLTGFAKNAKENLDEAERNKLRTLSDQLVRSYGDVK